MQREWEPEELVSCWTLVESEWRVIELKRSAPRLAFGLPLKFFKLEGRFPRHVGELPRQAVAYVAEEVHVEAALLTTYGWSGRTIERHRAQIRAALGFRECAREDEARLERWLAEEVCPVELADERQREALVGRCRAERIEPPGQIERLVAGARAATDQRFCDATLAWLPGPHAPTGPSGSQAAAGGQLVGVALDAESPRPRCCSTSSTTDLAAGGGGGRPAVACTVVAADDLLGPL